MSQVGPIGKPSYPQIAYDGYTAALEAFLWATASGKKTLASYYQYPLPPVTLTAPIPLPRLCVTLKAPISDKVRQNMMSGWTKYGISEVSLSAKVKGFTFDNPSFSMIPRLNEMMHPSCNAPDHYCTLESFIACQKVYEAVELFLRTHTYPAFSSIENLEAVEGPLPPPNLASQSRKRPSEKETTSRRKARVIGELGAMLAVRADTPEPDESTIDVFSDVLVAKPSPLPSSVNWGSPSSTPNLPGLCFPYFDGLLAGDPVFVKSTIASFFFKLLGDEDTDPRSAYLAFKNSIGSYCYTRAGLVMSHILCGIQLALQCQGQLYLFLEKTTEYSGFAILGAGFHINIGSRWHAPKTPDELREDILMVSSHESRLEEICQILARLRMTEGKKRRYTAEDINSSGKLGEVLSTIDFSREEDEETIRLLSFNLSHLNFGDTFLTNNIEHIEGELENLYSAETPLPDPSKSIFLLSEQLELYHDPLARHLLRFGSRAPSFFARTGEIYPVPSPTAKDIMLEDDKKTGRPKLTQLVVTFKPIPEALRDLHESRNKKAIRFESKERAKDSRCVTFKEKAAKRLWTELKRTLGNMPGGLSKGKGKAKAAMEVDPVDFEDVTFD